MKKALTALVSIVISISLLGSYDMRGNTTGASNIGNQNTSRVYRVIKGDSLRSIAKKFYDDADKWEVIFDANRDIKYVDMIKPGTKLNIPFLNSLPSFSQKTEILASDEKRKGLDKHVVQLFLFPVDKDLFQSQISYNRKEIINEITGVIAPGVGKAKKSHSDPGGIVWTEIPKQDVECVDHDGKRQKKMVAYYQNSIGMKFVYLNPLNKEASKELIKLEFYIGATEVTEGQCKEIMGIDCNITHFKGDDFPMENVTWNKASEFCYKLSRKEGKSYRLPTEAEWEYACRAKTATKYYCGNTITPKLANFRPSHGTKPVGSYPANMWGIYDLHGNVGEWCIDEYKLGQKIMRGGSYRSYPKDLESGNRGYSSPNDRSIGNGFRVVVEIE